MQTLGIIDIVWKGRKLAAEKGSKVKLGGLKNNAVPFGRQVGRAQEFEPSEVTATIPLKKGERVADIFSMDEGELQVLCDTGQTFVAPDAFIMNRPEMTGGEGGKIEVKWSCGEMEEII
jgi:hypothetical protein